MVKFESFILISILFGPSLCQDYEVISCNSNENNVSLLGKYGCQSLQWYFKEPQLSFKIAKKYFKQNLAGRENEFILEDDFYKMTVTEDSLDIAVREDDDSESFVLSKNQTWIKNLIFQS